MSDLEMFCQLAINILKYPYDKAIFYREGRLSKADVYPRSCFGQDTISFYNGPDLKEIDILLGNDWNSVSTMDLRNIKHVITEIKLKCNKEVKAALLEGIE